MPHTRLPCPEHIVLDLDASTRWEALRTVGTLIERAAGLSAPPIFRALWRREQAQSTALGHGVALPHARILGIREPVSVYARTRAPINFAAPDRGLVSQLFVILVPESADNEQHLELLALIARMFSDRLFRARLAAAGDEAAVRCAFEDWIDLDLGALDGAVVQPRAARSSA